MVSSYDSKIYHYTTAEELLQLLLLGGNKIRCLKHEVFLQWLWPYATWCVINTIFTSQSATLTQVVSSKKSRYLGCGGTLSPILIIVNKGSWPLVWASKWRMGC